MTPDEQARVAAAVERWREMMGSDESADDDGKYPLRLMMDDAEFIAHAALAPITPEEIEEAAKSEYESFQPRVMTWDEIRESFQGNQCRRNAKAAIASFLRSRGLDTTKGD